MRANFNVTRQDFWIDENRKQLLIQIKQQDEINFAHLEACDGCPECDVLMEFYSGCENCNILGHKSVLYYIKKEGYYLCEKCYENQRS